jgi:hypothetical protein
MRIEKISRITTIDGMGEVVVFWYYTSSGMLAYGMMSLDRQWIRLHETADKWVELHYGFSHDLTRRVYKCNPPGSMYTLELDVNIIKPIDDFLFEREFLTETKSDTKD